LTADIAIGVIKAARHKLNNAIQFAAGVVLLVAVLMLIDCLLTDIGILDEHFIVGELSAWFIVSVTTFVADSKFYEFEYRP